MTKHKRRHKRRSGFFDNPPQQISLVKLDPPRLNPPKPITGVKIDTLYNYDLLTDEKILLSLSTDEHGVKDRCLVSIIDGKTGDTINKFYEPEKKNGNAVLLVSKPHSLIYTAYENEIFVWDENGNFKQKLSGHKDYVGHLLQLDDDKVLSVGDCSSEIIVWDGSTGEQLWRLDRAPYFFNNSFINSCFSMLNYMNVSQSLLACIVSYLPYREVSCGNIKAVTKLMNGDIACGTGQGFIFVLDQHYGNCKQIFKAREEREIKSKDRQLPTDTITTLQALPNGDVVVGYYNSAVLIWDMQTQTIKERLRAPGDDVGYKINNVQLSKNYLFVLSETGLHSDTYNLDIWNIETRQHLKCIRGIDYCNRYNDKIMPVIIKDNGDLSMIINKEVYTLPIDYLLNYPEKDIYFNNIPFVGKKTFWERMRLG